MPTCRHRSWRQVPDRQQGQQSNFIPVEYKVQVGIATKQETKNIKAFEPRAQAITKRAIVNRI